MDEMYCAGSQAVIIGGSRASVGVRQLTCIEPHLVIIKYY